MTESVTKKCGLVALFTISLFFSKTLCELYSSTEQLSNWPLTAKHILIDIDEHIRLEESTLPNLRDRISSLEDVIAKLSQGYSARANHANETKANPIEAFVDLYRKIDILDDIRNRTDYEFYKIKTILQRVENLYETLKAVLPSENDLIGAGEAIIRLQKFYKLSTSDLVEGKLPSEKKSNENRSVNSVRLNQLECFQLGKIAYSNEDYPTAMEWFYKSLELMHKERDQNREDNPDNLINDVLDHLAFSAYKSKEVEYAAEITKILLKRDPDNERAKSNLDYYLDELESKRSGIVTEPDEQTNSLPVGNYKTYEHLTADNYVLSDDDVLRGLCTGSLQAKRHELCFVNNTFYQNPFLPIVRTEVLNKSPYIIRIHDIITDNEAGQIRKSAMERLERSTVQSVHNASSIESNFRIAKTAWLDWREVGIVERLEDRLRSLTGLRLEMSEALQVVNYGLGGFYGPHLDSRQNFRNDQIVLKDEEGNTSVIEIPLPRIHNDRLATILIYLNYVEAGGATVFPRIQLTVEPIKNSAVIWYNHDRDGHTNPMTLHSGCPVLLGTKWIATKWPRDDPNIFVRPCGLRDE